MTYLYLKALHIIAVVAWFAGLFYLVRLFIYHVEAQERPESERKILQSQFAIMERRLWFGITVPAMIGTVVSGSWLAFLLNVFSSPWFIIKLVLVMGLLLYHTHLGRIRRQFVRGEIRWSSKGLRMYNEVATLFLVTIVFVVVVRYPQNLVNPALIFFAIILVTFGWMLLKKRSTKKIQA